MNLIEQLGGYEKTKKQVNRLESKGNLVTAEGMKLELLQYRRQHNIYEVGDDVVFINQNMSSSIKTIKEILNNTHVSFNFHGFHIKLIRHATDAEIKAGKRL